MLKKICFSSTYTESTMNQMAIFVSSMLLQLWKPRNIRYKIIYLLVTNKEFTNDYQIYTKRNKA